jgi:hypothetical protein
VKGVDLERIRTKLLQKISSEQTDKVLANAVSVLNAMPAGAVANKAQKPAKIAVEESVPRQTLPDPSTIGPQINEILSTFKGSSTDIDIDPARDFNHVDVNDLFSRQGIDETMR